MFGRPPGGEVAKVSELLEFKTEAGARGPGARGVRWAGAVVEAGASLEQVLARLRERRELYLHALGYSYDEIAALSWGTPVQSA